MRIRKKTVIAVLGLCIATYIYVHLNYMSFSNYMDPPWNRVQRCSNSNQELRQLVDLASEVHRVLTKLNIDHWLMYGSIFGAMRMEGPLPWDNDVDIGFCGDCSRFDSFGTIENFLTPFKEAGLIVTNKWTQSGTIVFSRPNQTLTVDLFAFYEHNGWKKRRGLESWLFFVNYNYHHTFPSWVVKPPLPQTKFGHSSISVPKGEFEILKHLYKDNWWKEMRPRGC
ncbi:fukutin-related protein-like [Exaiptasia diaphana]|uniref:LicD/FKTN/FKRP nucleotidyltransferase domain-containing protein n=1 Tax=Exaiptasia diaphana TaxID=2652724 RepID=A0A913Y224_EXADI|nr:fukutin-related protein-like [Exaiptasia diaphana]